MRKALGLMGLVGLIGCADFHTQIPVSWYILADGKRVEIKDVGRAVILEYNAPESGDGEMDDTVSLTCHETFCYIESMDFPVGGSGRFYGFGILVNYKVENDNDGDPSNNVLGFSARRW